MGDAKDTRKDRTKSKQLRSRWKSAQREQEEAMSLKQFARGDREGRAWLERK